MKNAARLSTFIFLALLFASARLYAAEQKYAFIEIGKVFDEYEKTKSNDKVLQEEGQSKQKQRDALVDEVRRLRDEQAILAEDKKKQAQENIEKKLKELEDFDQNARKNLGEKRNQVMSDIFADIEGVLKKYGEREGYDFIFNDRALVYHNPKYDRTQDVLKELNAEFKKKKV